MKKNILYTLALLSIFASCAKTELPHFGDENDPDAVVISPSVAVLSSKSNPLGDYEAQKKFNEGDIITIKDLSDGEVYTYKLTNGSWKPTDGKCLLWHDETLDIEAYYGTEGEDPYRRVLDQSDAAKIAAADYMTCQGCEPFPRILGNELMFTLERRKALVTVVIASYGDQYNPNNDFITELSIGEIKPYIRNKNDEYSPNSGGTIGYKYSAIIPQDLSFSITYKIGQDLRIVDLTSNTNFGAGNSYTINLRVGKDKIEVGDITVSDWGSTYWDNAEADIDAPYVTFSADKNQTFKMYFGSDFTLGTNEYFEYSVGGGNWVRFTGSISDVTFGGSNGDLRLRGKSSHGTAIDDYYGCGTIWFHDTSVPVYCTGDIRTLIDYEAYGTVSTADAKFCCLFSYNNTMLRTAPELPATTLANQCYAYMFQACTSLTTAPVLPAEILAENCYEYMFNGCTALSSVTMKATDVSATSCLNNWLNDAGTSATSRTLTLENDDVYYAISANSDYLPDNWKSGQATINYKNFTPYVTFSAENDQNFSMILNLNLDGTNEYFEYSVGGSAWNRFTGTVSDVAFGGSKGDLRLRGKSSKGTAYIDENGWDHWCKVQFSDNSVPVECDGDIRTLVDYENYSTANTANVRFMCLFEGCAALTSAPELPATTLASKCYISMFEGCSSLTAAPALPANTLADLCYSSMFTGCTKLTTAPALPATTLAPYCYSSMFEGCIKLTTAPVLPATTLAKSCYDGMFYSCSSLTAAPELIAPALVASCYSNMFTNCTSLTEIHLGATSGFDMVDGASMDNPLNGWLYETNSGGIVYCTQELLNEANSNGSFKGYVATAYGWTIELGNYTP